MVEWQNQPPYPVKAIANYFLSIGREKGVPVDPMKLQKLIYFAHGWHLAIHHRSLIDEPVEAWQYGPVIRTVYDEFKRYGRDPIPELALEFNGRRFYRPAIPAEDSQTRALLDRVWEVYGSLSGIQLSNLSHERGSPWEEAWQRAQQTGKRLGTDIDDERIRGYFEHEALKSRAEQRPA